MTGTHADSCIHPVRLGPRPFRRGANSFPRRCAESHPEQRARRSDPSLQPVDTGLERLRAGDHDGGVRSEDVPPLHHRTRRISHHVLFARRAVRHARRSSRTFPERRADDGRDSAEGDDPAARRARHHAAAGEGSESRAQRRRHQGVGKRARPHRRRLLRRAAHRHEQGLGEQSRALQAVSVSGVVARRDPLPDRKSAT